jgi:hypothetical protein
MVACPQQRSMAAPLLYTPLSLAIHFLPKNWSKSIVHGPDPFEDALKRPITTIPPSITTTHHDGSLLSPLSYNLTDNNPPLVPSHLTNVHGKI